MTLPPTATALLRALRDAGGSMAYRSKKATAEAIMWSSAMALVRVTRSKPSRVELTPAGRIEAARLATEETP